MSEPDDIESSGSAGARSDAKRRGDEIELMQHADGERELDVDDPGALAKLEALRHTKELVRGHLELAADEVADAKFAAMWREIAKTLDPAPGAHARHGRPVTVSDLVEMPQRGLGKRIVGWFERYRGHIFTGVISAGAVAALALVFRPAGDPIVTNGNAIDVHPAVYRPTEIESIETPAGNSAILTDETGTTTLIWVTPEDIVEGI